MGARARRQARREAQREDAARYWAAVNDRRYQQRSQSGRPLAWDAGRLTRTNKDWDPLHLGPNAMADMYLDRVRRRSRHAAENHPLVRNAVERLVDNAVSTEVRVEPDTPYPELNALLREKWKRAAEAVDAERCECLGESQRLFLREVVVCGECLPLFAVTDAFNGAPAGPALELVECERLDLGMSGRTASGARVRQAVEFDALGRRTAYHVLLEDPADGGVLGVWGWGGMIGGPGVRRISAADANLTLVRTRPKQIRGVPLIVASLLSVQTRDRFQEAYLELARAAACYGLYFTGVPVQKVMRDGSSYGDPETLVDGLGRPIQDTEPALMGFLPRGAEVKVASQNVPPPTYKDVLDLLNHELAAGANAGYAETTGDHRGTTYSAGRTETLERRRASRTVQALVVRNHTRPFYERWARFQFDFGLVALPSAALREYRADPEPFTRMRAIPPGFEWVDPLKEASAAQVELGLGITSVPDLCAAKGQDAMEVARRQAEYERAEAEMRAGMGLAPRPAPGNAAGDGGEGGGEEGGEGGEGEDGEERAMAAAVRARRARLNGTPNGVGGHA